MFMYKKPKILTINVSIIIIFCVCFSIAHSEYVGIINGKTAYPEQFPYQVSLQYYNGTSYNHFCGGSIIDKEWVLTAAHCLVGSVSYRSDIGVYAVAGITNLAYGQTNEQRIQVINFIIPTEYDQDTLQNDIALLQLSSPFLLGTYVNTVNLPELKQSSQGSANVSGWGAKVEGGENINSLQWINVNVITDANCAAMMDGHPVFDDMICSFNNGDGPCQGDSGSPMVSPNSDGLSIYQSGIVSWGVECGNVNYPTVYTEVSYYIDWISQYISL